MHVTPLAPVLPVAELGRAIVWYCARMGFVVGFVHAGHDAGLEGDGCRRIGG